LDAFAYQPILKELSTIEFKILNKVSQISLAKIGTNQANRIEKKFRVYEENSVETLSAKFRRYIHLIK
jgi:hypothetical protein